LEETVSNWKKSRGNILTPSVKTFPAIHLVQYQFDDIAQNHLAWKVSLNVCLINCTIGSSGVNSCSKSQLREAPGLNPGTTYNKQNSLAQAWYRGAPTTSRTRCIREDPTSFSYSVQSYFCFVERPQQAELVVSGKTPRASRNLSMLLLLLEIDHLGHEKSQSVKAFLQFSLQAQ